MTIIQATNIIDQFFFSLFRQSLADNEVATQRWHYLSVFLSGHCTSVAWFYNTIQYNEYF